MSIYFPLRSRTCARGLALATAIATLAGCASGYPLMPTPLLYRGERAKPLFAEVPADRQKPSIDLLYVTDRAPAIDPADPLPYTADRSQAIAYGSVTVEFDEAVTWNALVKESTAAELAGAAPPQAAARRRSTGAFRRSSMTLWAPRPDSREPLRSSTPTKKQPRASGRGFPPTRLLAQEGSGALRARLPQHLPGRRVHDGRTLCHFLGREFVCAIFTWPAGGTRGLFMGYNVDRESGEFAVEDLKKAIRIIVDTPGVERIRPARPQSGNRHPLDRGFRACHRGLHHPNDARQEIQIKTSC